MEELTPILSASSSSSSSSFSREWKYDVFLSFRGEDTRSGFTGHLYNALYEKGIRTFIDDRLERGEEITSALLETIEESRIAIVIFSVNYASSTFCLEELVKILERIEQKRGLVWPVFYKVDPSDVRHLRGSYGDALYKHKDDSRLQKWKLALDKAANLSGWHLDKGYKYEYKFIKGIVKEVSKRTKYIQLYVPKHLVGLKSGVDDLISLLDLESKKEVVMVGIYGIGGIGKTTIACAMYNVIVDQFESVCFLSDVRERSNQYGLLELQETLLFKLTGDKGIKMGNFREGIQLIKSRLCRKKVLLVLDDVNSHKQLKALVGEIDWFGFGSRIIIITRDKHLLDVHGVDRIYKVKKLCSKDALELFSWNAFKKNEVDSRYASISKDFVNYCNGLPLALEVIGSNLYNRTIEECKSALDRYKEIPDTDIQNVLKVSYDDLEQIEKEIFLDIACLFRGYWLQDVEKILQHGRGFGHDSGPKFSIRVVKEKSLIKIEHQKVKIHDLLAQMGREIVRSQTPLNPENRSRLWSYNDIISILEEDKGTDKIQALVLNMPQDKKVLWNGGGFMKMKNLKILIIESASFSCDPEYLPNSLKVLKWINYSSSTLPSDFLPRNLAILNFDGSSIEVLKPFKNFGSLTELVLSGCQFLKEVPDVSGAVNLRELDIGHCRNLIKVHDSVGLLDKLVRLNAKSCPNLRILPASIKSASLESLDLSRCYSLSTFPQILGFFEILTNFNSEPVRLRKSTISIQGILHPGQLSLQQHKGCLRLSCCTSMLPILENCKDVFQHSSGDNTERENAANPTAPVFLHVEEGRPSKPPDFPIVNNLANRYFSSWRPCYHILTTLELRDCNLRDEFLYKLLHWFPYLNYLDVTGNNFTILPKCMNGCLHLEILILDSCRDLREIEGIPPNIKRFSVLACMSLTSPSSRKLLSQAFHEDGGRSVAVPGYRIPKWIDHRCKRPSISFWCRNEFPRLALCYISVLRTINFSIFVNGIPISTESDPFVSWSGRPAITLLDVHEWGGEQRKIVLKEHEWNHVSISLEDIVKDGIIIYEMGVHAYKEMYTDNVRFIDPIYHNLDSITGFSLQKNFCPFPHMQVCSTADSRKLAGSNFYRFLNGDEPFSESISEPVRKARVRFYRFLIGDESSSQSSVHAASVRKEIWAMKAPAKVKFLVLRILDRSLPTCHELFIRELTNSPMCPICESEIETIEHVFLQCPWLRLLWLGSDSRMSKMQWFRTSIWINTYRDDFKLMAHILWIIWKVRNDFILRDKPVDPHEALMTAKAMYMDYSSNPCLLQIGRTRVGPSLEACTCTTREELWHEAYQRRKTASNKVDNKPNQRSKGKSNNTKKEANCDEGTEVENKAERKKRRESNSNNKTDPNFDKVEGSVVPLDHISRTAKESDVAMKKVEELHKQQEKANQIFLEDENKEEAHLQKRNYVMKRQSTTASNQPSNLETKKLQKKILATPQKSAQVVSANVTEQRTSSTDKNSFVPNPKSTTSLKCQEFSSWSISQLAEDFGKSEEPNIEQHESTFNQENPDHSNLNVQLEVPNHVIQPQNIAPDPKQIFPAETEPNSTHEKHSTGLNDNEEDDPFDVLQLLVSVDESISTSTSHVSEQESQRNNEKASQIKQTITILGSVLEQDFELLLSNQEDREKLESSLKILQSMTGEDAWITFGFKAFILQLRDQLPSMLENMRKSSMVEEKYQSLIRHKQSFAEFHKSGSQQKQQLADKSQACIEKVEANSNQISALRTRILELQKELEQLEKTQPELEAAVKAVEIEEQNLIQRANDAVKDFKSTTNKLSGIEAERKAMIEVRSETLIQWQNFRSNFVSSFKKLIMD